MEKSLLVLCLTCLLVLVKGNELIFDPQDAEILLKERVKVVITTEENSKGNATFVLTSKHDDIVKFDPSNFTINLNEKKWSFTLTGLNLGHDTVAVNVTPSNIINHERKAFVRVTVCKSKTLSLTSVIVGWVYFVAWSVSFYPQVYENWKRKSVVGLNFDFLTLNIIGFTLYSVFNCCLYWIPVIEDEYFSRHPKGLNPVLLNDIVFSVHAAIVTVFTIFQCLIYERGGQTVSKVARGIVVVFGLAIIVMMILSFTDVVHWLDFLYACSYIKLIITLIKYIPQAVMNYRRKSTIGWSIGNVVLDFTGGILSMLQMIINADNYNDWASIFGDPTKFGLGLFSVLFDIFFLIQHYILYRHAIYVEIPGNINESPAQSSKVNEGEEEASQNASNEKRALDNWYDS